MNDFASDPQLSDSVFESLLEASPDAVVISDGRGRIVVVNQQANRLFGYIHGELAGHPIEVLIPERFRSDHPGHRGAFYANPETRPMGAGLDLCGRRKDGSEFPAEISLSPLQTPEGLLVTAVVRDVSAQKTATDTQAQLLRQASNAEQRFRALLDSAPDAVLIVGADGRIQMINRMVEQLFGYRRDELVGHPVEALLPERFRELHIHHRRTYAAAPRTRAMGTALELFGRRQDGSEFPVEVSLSPLETADGGVVTAIVRDVTERKQTETERDQLLAEEQRTRARLVSILESTQDGIVFVDASTGHVRANERACRLFGQSIEPQLGTEQYTHLIRAPGGESLDELLTTRALRGETVLTEELLILRPDGKRIPVLAQAAPVMGPDGSVIGAVKSFQDISLLKELEKMRDEWTSVIAHDLRQPVTAIAAYAQYLSTLAESDAPREDVGATAEHIQVAAEMLHRMIADLLDASRLASGHPGLEPFAADIRLIASGAVERARRTVDRNTVRLEIKGGLPRVEVDPPRIEQVLSNLISNAAKYGLPESEIIVEVASKESLVQVSVANRGAGISEEELPHLFARFRRSAEARASGVAGLGLGLYICKQIVEAHRGRIWVESTPGEVTTFRFTLPLAA